MTPEELLKPRYKVIADWPNRKDFHIGQIVTLGEVWNPGYLMYTAEDCQGKCEYLQDFFTQYPHLFERVEWWQERGIEDMPEYLKLSPDNNSSLSIGGEEEPYIHKVKHHWTSSPRLHFHSSSFNCFISEWKDNSYSYNQFVPVTEQEYLNYKNSQP